MFQTANRSTVPTSDGRAFFVEMVTLICFMHFADQTISSSMPVSSLT